MAPGPEPGDARGRIDSASADPRKTIPAERAVLQGRTHFLLASAGDPVGVMGAPVAHMWTFEAMDSPPLGLFRHGDSERRMMVTVATQHDG